MKQIVETALAAYNRVWRDAKVVEAHTITEIQTLAMTAALEAVFKESADDPLRETQREAGLRDWSAPETGADDPERKAGPRPRRSRKAEDGDEGAGER